MKASARWHRSGKDQAQLSGAPSQLRAPCRRFFSCNGKSFVNQTLLKALGFISREDSRAWPSPPPCLPEFSFHELHESRMIRARPQAIIDAVAGLDMRADRVADIMLSLRELPARLIRKLRRGSAPESVPFGFHTFTLLARSEHEIVRGLAGRFWRPDLDIEHIASASQFQQLADPALAKLVLRFEVIEHPNQLCTLRTETFVYCATARTRLLFTPYWLAIRLASGWIRRRTLASIEQALNHSHQ